MADTTRASCISLSRLLCYIYIYSLPYLNSSTLQIIYFYFNSVTDPSEVSPASTSFIKYTAIYFLHIVESIFLHRASTARPNMETPSAQQHDRAHAREEFEDHGQKCRQFKGIRLRKWGSWVSEIRMPRSRVKLWLGSYPSAQQAARAYDAAAYCLRGSNAKFNFPNSVPDIPSASSLSRRQIQATAAKYAWDQLPSSPPFLENINNKATEEASSPSRLASVSETKLSSDSHKILEEHELDMWESLFEGSDRSNDGCLGLNLERMPSVDHDALALELIPTTWQEEEHMNNIFDTTELWNF